MNADTQRRKRRANHFFVVTPTEARCEFDLFDLIGNIIGTLTGISLALLGIVQLAHAFGWRP